MSVFCLWTSSVFSFVSKLNLNYTSQHIKPIMWKSLPTSPASYLPAFYLSTLGFYCPILHFALIPPLPHVNVVNSNQSFKCQFRHHLLPASLASTIWVRCCLHFPIGTIALRTIYCNCLLVRLSIAPYPLFSDLSEGQECILFIFLPLVLEPVDAHEFVESMSPYLHLS